MVQNKQTKEQAIALRKRGLSYREILAKIPVAKSTLASWLYDVRLAKRHQRRITEKQRLSALRGAESRRNQRLSLIDHIQQEAHKDIDVISRRELWFMGIMLYWAEGSKEKEGRPGLGVRFTNSDPRMIKLFLKWLKEAADVKEEYIHYSIYIHENSKNNIDSVRNYWLEITGFPRENPSRVYFKKNKIRTNRKNIGKSYFGVLRIEVRASSSLNRKIAGWISGINKYYWGVV